MDKRRSTSVPGSQALRLEDLAKKKEQVRPMLAVTAKKLSLKAKQIVVTAKKNEAEAVVVLKDKEQVRPMLAVTAKKLSLKAKQIVVTAKKNEAEAVVVLKDKEHVRRKLAVTAQGKESVRHKLAITAKKLRTKAKVLAVTAQKKERVRSKLVVTAKKKENVRSKLVVTAKGKENVRRKLEITAGKLRRKAKQLAVTAREKESVRSKLVVTAKEKENVRRKLVVTAEQLRLKARQLAVIAKEKESVRHKLEITANDLARAKARRESVRRKLVVTAKEKENVRRKLVVTADQLRRKAKQLAVIAKERESVRHKLAVTAEELRLKAKQLAVTAKERESVRHKLVVTAKEKENVRRKLVVTARQLRLKARQLAVIANEKENVRRKLAVTAKELQQARAKEEAILASIGDGVMACNKDGRVMLFNRVAEVLTGFSSKEAIGRHYSQTMKFVKEGSGKIGNDFIAEAIAKQRVTTMSGNTLLIRKDGRKIPVADSAAPIRGVSVAFIGCVVVFRDVTREREVDKAKSEFVSLASHQLRTPLTTVSWYSERLLSGHVGELSDKQKNYLDEVYKGNQRMVVLVNALLNVSRLELGTFVVEPEPTDVVKLAHRMMDELKLQITQRQLKFKERHTDGLPLLNADPKLLGMVFQNLLSNAVKYTPDKGSVSIDLRVVKHGETIHAFQPNEDSMAIIVSDTGFGIPESQQYKIFTKLFRADNVRERDTEGTGLGLYIVKSVVEHSGGKIWFESTENRGSTFFITLPLAGMKKKEGTKVLE